MFNLFSRSFADSFLTLVIGATAFTFYIISLKILELNFFSVFIASIYISISEVSFDKLNIITETYAVVLACITPLLPGIEIVNSIRSIFQGDYISGIVQGTKAVTNSMMIAFPIGFIVEFLL